MHCTWWRCLLSLELWTGTQSSQQLQQQLMHCYCITNVGVALHTIQHWILLPLSNMWTHTRHSNSCNWDTWMTATAKQCRPQQTTRTVMILDAQHWQRQQPYLCKVCDQQCWQGMCRCNAYAHSSDNMDLELESWCWRVICKACPSQVQACAETCFLWGMGFPETRYSAIMDFPRAKHSAIQFVFENQLWSSRLISKPQCDIASWTRRLQRQLDNASVHICWMSCAEMKW